MDEHQSLVIDARTSNEGDGWVGSGANPWHLDSQTNSILFLTDEGNKPVRIGVDVTVGLVHYYLIRLKLAPHETRAINLRALRDAQVPDFKGHKIPAGATDGSVNWIRLDSVPVEGRLMVIEKQQGMASSYDCTTCQCPAVLVTLGVAPGLFGMLPLQVQPMSSTATYTNCNGGNQFYYDETNASVWDSSNTGVIQMDSSIHRDADGIAAGTSNVSGSYTDCSMYDSNPDFSCPCMSTFTASGSGTGNVCGLSISSPTSGQVINMGGSYYDTATIPLKAASACSGTASWTLNFTYTRGSGTSYTGSATTSTTINQNTNYTTPVGEGGEVSAQAQATLAGQSFAKAVTFYVLGTTIPDPTITSRLDSLYSGGTTPNLLTGIASRESSYMQFNSQETRMGKGGEWPNESPDGGSHVGLMQFPNSLKDGFDWLTNTYDGYNLFEAKLTSAHNYVSNQITAHPSLPAVTGSQYEDDAVVYYGPYGSAGPYWVPSSDYSTWVPNPNNTNGVDYADEVRSDRK